MKIILKVLLWAGVAIFGLYEALCLWSLIFESKSELFPSAIIGGAALLATILALRKINSPKQPKDEKPAPDSAASNAVPGSVVYRPMPFSDALEMQRYVVVDVETTGLYPEKNEIIEVAAIRNDGGNLSAYSSFVRPRGNIPPEITKLTGIRFSDVRSAPTISQIAPELLSFIEGFPVVAHNAVFDVKFLAAAFEKCGISSEIDYIDTVQFARAAFPGLKNYKLKNSY